MDSKIWEVHWWTPALMTFSFFAGLAFAIGHHFFCNSLTGKAPRHSYHLRGLSYDVSAQQVNVAIGTAFAFLVNHLLRRAVETAYDQTIWRAVKKDASKISDVDALFSFSFFTILNIRLWRRYPLLMILGGVSWIVSIASVFTPATLTVTLAEARNETLLRVSRVDFTSLNFANLPMQAGLSPGYTYTGPQYTVQRIVTATAAQGQILPISAPYVNSSWTLKFPGPALRCDAVEESAHNDIIANIAAVMKEAECFTSYGYVAWTPDTDGSLPFVKENNGTYSQRSGSIGPTLGDNPMSIFLAAFPRMFNEMPGETTVDCNNSQAYLVDATIIQCLLYNASYFANFTYSDGAQNVGISIADDYNDMLYLGGVGSFLATTSPDGVYIFGPDGQPVAYNVTPVETFAYQAVMDSFGMVLVGSIANEDINSIGEIVTTNTTVMSTVLSQTKELSFLENYSNAVGYSLENPSINTTWNGLSVNVSSSGSLPVAKSLEVLFQNATISLMSNALLQPNYSSPYAPPMAEVTTTPYQDIYVYSADVLWIAYGIAGAIALICVFIGIVTLLRARATYTNKFSTVLRTTRAAELSSQLQPVDMVGNDPLPGHIADATIKFARKQDLLTQGMEKVKMDTSSKISGVGRSQTA